MLNQARGQGRRADRVLPAGHAGRLGPRLGRLEGGAIRAWCMLSRLGLPANQAPTSRFRLRAHGGASSAASSSSRGIRTAAGDARLGDAGGFMSGLYGALGVLMALRSRDAKGSGEGEGRQSTSASAGRSSASRRAGARLRQSRLHPPAMGAPTVNICRTAITRRRRPLDRHRLHERQDLRPHGGADGPSQGRGDGIYGTIARRGEGPRRGRRPGRRLGKAAQPAGSGEALRGGQGALWHRRVRR